MYKSTVKKSNVIINPLKRINNENNIINKKTFLLEENTKKLNITKNNSNKQLLNTKSEIGFYSKYNDDLNDINKKNNTNDLHNIKKEAFLQKLKDMIFSPGDINYNEKEQEYNNNYNMTHNILKHSNRTKSSDKLFDLKNNENGSTNNHNNYNNNKYPKYNINVDNLHNTNNKIILLPNKLDNKKTLVLDLDETLIHSAFEPFRPKDDIKLKMKIKNEEYIIHVLKRPYLDEFLKIVTQKYEVVIFTASIPDYANPLLDQLDPFKKISYRLFREHCTRTDNGLFIKDLNKLGRNLKDVIIIDNNPISYTLNKMNGLPILTWHSIQSDNELIKLIPLLLYLTNVDDIRIVINKVVNGYYVNYKEVNKIIRNNNNLLNNNKEEDDYFKNWFSNPKKIEINKNNKKNDIKDNDKKKDNNFNNFNDINIKKKESTEQIIKYKGLLGSENKFNFDNYKRAHHIKMFSGFLDNKINGINPNTDNNFKNNNGNLEIKKKLSFFEYDKNNKNNNIIANNTDKQPLNKKNNSSKNLTKINKKLNDINNENNNNNNNIFNSKYFNKDISPIKNNKNKQNISNSIFNFDYINNSKLNITDGNITINPNIRNNNTNNTNTNIINNNIYLINNQSLIINTNNNNNNTIEHSSRNMFNNDNNPKIMGGYQSANYFFHKKKRSESAKYKNRQNNNNKSILSDLIDNLIKYNKNNKKKNIESNQLIAISNNNKCLYNENINNNHKINNLILNKIKTGRELYDRYNSRNKEKLNTEEENRHIINAFLNNKINIKNINTIDDYKNNNNIYLNTGNNLENYIHRIKKDSFLYGDNNYKFKDTNSFNNIRINNYYSNNGKNKTIKYLSPNSNYKIEI